MNRGHKQKILIIMGFAKAFGKVPNIRHLHKLEYYGIIRYTYRLIDSWLFGRTQQVALDGEASVPVLVVYVCPRDRS